MAINHVEMLYYFGDLHYDLAESRSGGKEHYEDSFEVDCCAEDMCHFARACVRYSYTCVLRFA